METIRARAVEHKTITGAVTIIQAGIGVTEVNLITQVALETIRARAVEHKTTTGAVPIIRARVGVTGVNLHLTRPSRESVRAETREVSGRQLHACAGILTRGGVTRVRRNLAKLPPEVPRALAEEEVIVHFSLQVPGKLGEAGPAVETGGRQAGVKGRLAPGSCPSQGAGAAERPAPLLLPCGGRARPPGSAGVRITGVERVLTERTGEPPRAGTGKAVDEINARPIVGAGREFAAVDIHGAVVSRKPRETLACCRAVAVHAEHSSDDVTGILEAEVRVD